MSERTGTRRRLCLVAALVFVALAAPLPAQESAAPQVVGPRMVRFYPAGLDPARDSFSPALAAPRPSRGDAAADWPVVPRFDRIDDWFRAHVETGQASLYGTGEVIGPLLRNGDVTLCWNKDASRYLPSSKNLYQSHPWVLAVRPDGSAFGVLANTTRRCWIDLRTGITFRAEGAPFSVIIIDRESPQEVVKGLAELTGTMPLPPLWALGYQQCRWSYYPDTRVRQIAEGFRHRKIPCDVIWMDIDYMDGFRLFTFEPAGFPDPAGLNRDLHAMGFKTVWMIDPGVKVDPGYAVYDGGTEGNHWVRTASGEEYHGNVWPGPCAFPDFTRPGTRAWWGALYKDFIATGVDGVWNDMNEPSVFGGPGGTMPDDNVHRGGDDLPPGTHAQYHNVYGMLMARATREGMQAAAPDRRPFVLTRANHIGGQRYAATWTGDNTADWDHLRASVPMALNLGLSGQPFCGPDIGGFHDDGDPTLFARWMGVGTLLPFARAHTAKGTRDKEPWALGEEVETSCRISIQRRYRLLPYLYTLFREASISGLPVARPVFFADPADPMLRPEDAAFLLGNDLLVVPELSKQHASSPALPKGTWRPVSIIDGDTAAVHQPELRIRAGAIIPLGRVVQSTTEELLKPLTLLVCPDADGNAEGTLYEDAGDGYAYLSGEYRLTTYAAQTSNGVVYVSAARREGRWPATDRLVKIELVTEAGVVTEAGPESKPIAVDAGSMPRTDRR